MAVSQFILYTSNDSGAPVLNGITGSLMAVLNGCLVTGYGNKPGAGWTKPIADVTGSALGTPVVGGFRQGAGSRYSLFVNDDGYHSTALGREASVTAWENLTNPSGTLVVYGPQSYTASLGGGTGNFPAASRVIWRKSVNADTTARGWIVAADSRSFYIWASSGDAAGRYYFGSFGEAYSEASIPDYYCCILTGRIVDNTAAGHTSPYADWQDGIADPRYFNIAQPGHHLARSLGGGTTSMTFFKKGDSSAPSDGATQSPYMLILAGQIQTPNGPNNSFYVSPIWIVEPAANTIRGRFRGLYQICHPNANFSDGQIFVGSGEFAGKRFRVVKQSTTAGLWALEISPSIEINTWM